MVTRQTVYTAALYVAGMVIGFDLHTTYGSMLGLACLAAILAGSQGATWFEWKG